MVKRKESGKVVEGTQNMSNPTVTFIQPVLAKNSKDKLICDNRGKCILTETAENDVLAH